MEKEELKENIENKKNPATDNHEKERDTVEENLKVEEEKKEIEEKLSPEEEIEKLKDKLARTFAEMENQRRRFEKEKEDAYDYGGFAFAKEALNIINKDMLSIFKKNNIEPVKSINEKLDPNLHQAMMELEDDSKEPGTIVQEIQKGFMMKDRLLRPSLVGVSKKIIKEDKKDEKNQ